MLKYMLISRNFDNVFRLFWLIFRELLGFYNLINLDGYLVITANAMGVNTILRSPLEAIIRVNTVFKVVVPLQL